jgi:hypothetical protein
MNVEIGTEAAQFPEKEYISGIFLAVWPYKVAYPNSFQKEKEVRSREIRVCLLIRLSVIPNPKGSVLDPFLFVSNPSRSMGFGSCTALPSH